MSPGNSIRFPAGWAISDDGHGKVLFVGCRVGSNVAGQWWVNMQERYSVSAEGERGASDLVCSFYFLIFVLEAVELPVDAAMGEELLVGAVLA